MQLTSSRSFRVALVVGTRPEAIKLGPVIQALNRRSDRFEVKVLLTGQHREIVADILPLFEVVPDLDLNLMSHNQQLPELTARVITGVSAALAQLQPGLLVVQGDTTSVFGAALAAFYARIPTAHVEAGLRTGDVNRPFPEEANRQLTTVVSSIHFAPTAHARGNLLAAGVEPERIVVTGNTVVDALAVLSRKPFSIQASPLRSVPFGTGRVLLVTAHRRETWGEGLRNICGAVLELCRRFPDLLCVYPVHPNPNVTETVQSLLSKHPRIHLLEPLNYLAFIHLMRRSTLILSDSGGVQEEAPSLGKQVLLLRDVTERPEAFDMGFSKVVGTDPRRIVEESSRILAGLAHGAAPSCNPYGDAAAADRIARALLRYADGDRPLLNPEEEFRPPLTAGVRHGMG